MKNLILLLLFVACVICVGFGFYPWVAAFIMAAITVYYGMFNKYDLTFDREEEF